MKSNLSHNVLKLTLLFSGVSTLGLFIAMAIHELGHIIVVLYYGGRVTNLHLQPFSRSVVSYSVPASASQLWIASGGIVFSMIMGGLAFLLARKIRSPYGLPVIMTGVAAFIGNGFYFVFGAIMYGGFGDPAKLMASGCPAYGLVIWGGVLFILGCLAFLANLPLLGIGPEDSWGRRSVIFAGGIAPYLICVMVYNAVFDETRIPHYFTFIVGTIFMLLAGAFMTRFLSERLRWLQRPAVRVCWKHAWFAVYLSVLVITIELVSF